MKLCSICDKKITGTWCKNCHRFVKTYDISDGIHFNESHNPRNDAGCTYHTGASTQGNVVRTSGAGTTATRQTYTQTTTRTQTTTGTQTAGTKSAGNGKKKNGKTKLVVILIILYVVCNFIGAMVPTIKNCVGALSEEFKESYNEGDDPFVETPEQKEPEEEKVEGPAYEEKLAALEKLTPVDEYEGEGYLFTYYDAQDISTLGFSCDEAHFDMKVSEFEKWLSENWQDSYETEDGSTEYQNYFYEAGTETWMSFSMYRDYYASDDFAVRSDYDTATSQLHIVGYAAMDDIDETKLYYKTLRLLDPDTDWTQKYFQEALKEALNGEEEYVCVYSSEVLYIELEQMDGYYYIAFLPVSQ